MIWRYLNWCKHLAIFSRHHTHVTIMLYSKQNCYSPRTRVLQRKSKGKFAISQIKRWKYCQFSMIPLSLLPPPLSSLPCSHHTTSVSLPSPHLHYKKTLDFLGKNSSENTPFSSENTDFREITEETGCRKFSIYSYGFSEEIYFPTELPRKDSQESILQTATSNTRFPTKIS